MLFLTLFVMLLAPAATLCAQSAAAKNLEMYWIDVEGGAATLIVAPSGQSLLIDTGWAVGDRDAKRIYAAAQQAGLNQIDHLVLSHYHADHAGGLAALSKMIRIGRFYGRGDDIEKENQQWLDSFVNASQGRRTIVNPGDTIPIAGLEALVVASDGKLLDRPVKGRAQSVVRHRGREGRGGSGKPAHGGHAAYVREIQISGPPRPRLGKGDGTGVPDEQAGPGHRLSNQPPRLI